MWLFSRKGASGSSWSSTAEEVTNGLDASKLTAIVTGASSGIGAETARVLALRGAHVVMGVRNMDVGRDVKDKIVQEIPTAKVDVMELDLSSMSSVRNFASEYKASNYPLNILINNAGVANTPFTLTKDDVELQFATNHLGHFLLTNLLLDPMRKTARESGIEGRIINLSSILHQYPYAEGIRFDKINDPSEYNSYREYGQSKLANILHANELAKQLKDEGVQITANSLHPGEINTNVFRHNKMIDGFVKLARYFMKNVPQGAATTCYVALHPQVKGISGEYFSDCNPCKRTSLAQDDALARKLWDFSMSLIEK